MKIDDINLAIIKQLRNGRTPIKQMAESLSVAENTVRARIAKMEEEGILEVVGLVDPEKLSHHRIVIVGIKLSNMNLVKKGEEFSRLKGVVAVSVVTGRFDLILVVLLNEEFGLLEFYTQEVSRMTDVRSVETFVVYKSYNLKMPYIL
jgi:Lrp/AsnC family transcriptional regulator for asnA, asnC and gidA